MGGKKEVATLAGGCFWCLEEIYKQLKGVESSVSGYAGGDKVNPTYEEVSSGNTGHAEVVQITYDPNIISYSDILDVFWTIHNPTTLNKQGADEGTQYRSAIFYANDEQKRIAEESLNNISKSELYSYPIVTEIVPLKEFYRAEDYHQNYFENHPNQPYCTIVIEPKVSKFRKHFFDKLKK